jgi:hypothetical protein
MAEKEPEVVGNFGAEGGFHFVKFQGFDPKLSV